MSTPAAALRLRRAERRVAILQALVEDRDRELSITHQQASAVHAYLLGLNNVIPGALISATPEGAIIRANPGAHELLGYDELALMGQSLAVVWPQAGDFLQRHAHSSATVIRDEAEWIAKDGGAVPVLLTMSPHRGEDGQVLSLVFVGLDLRERRRLEVELRHAQKLESLGQLSAGVAHEINTPMQFIGDNLHFIQEAFESLLPLGELVAQLPQVLESAGQSECATRLRNAAESADLEYTRERLPKAIHRALEGVDRVSRIVEAMKAFSHPGNEMAPADINRSLSETLIVAHNEYKYVADLETEFGELPQVMCNRGDLNQVFLNLLVNAAHAIQPQMSSTGEKGHIRVRTWREDEQVVVAIADTGAGIPVAIRHRIFDPFFTTKEVGKGTGQGLAITRSIVVERHGGSLSFDSEVGSGTTFYVRIPIQAAVQRELG